MLSRGLLLDVHGAAILKAQFNVQGRQAIAGEKVLHATNATKEWCTLAGRQNVSGAIANLGNSTGAEAQRGRPWRRWDAQRRS